MIDYNQYIMSVREKIFYVITAAIVIFVIGLIFYRNCLIALLLCPLALFYPEIKRKEIIKRRKAELSIQFKDMLYSLSSSLSAGKSVELAIKDIVNDLEIIYPEADAYINQEIKWMIRNLEMNQPIELLFHDFAQRSGIDDIYNFSEVFSVANRAGGNLIEVIKNTSSIINDKIEIQQEIDIMLAEKKFEQRILNIIPILIILLLSIYAEDYIKPVFYTLPGRIVMTICLLLFIAAFLISKKISDIRV
ncbi:MAG TPA: pilus assembly protein TadB [Clostridiaceae bacterium]|nr:pilus assembly protein TadB [Clostridiaceae bacterium]